MTDSWCFRNHENTLGPFSTPEIKNLAAAGILQPDDVMWPEGGKPSQGTLACQVLDFSTLDRVAVAAPDWLGDVQEEKGPSTAEWGKSEGLDWLADVGRIEGLQPPATPPPPPPSSPSTAQPRVPPAELPPQQHPLAIPMALPVEPTPPFAAEASPDLFSIPLAIPAAPEPSAVPPAVPVAAEASETVVGAAPATPAHARDTVIRLMGFDPRTGQVTDPEQFRKWTKEQAKQTRTVSELGKSLQEIYHDAKRALADWVDADHNRDLILRGDAAAIHRDPALQECLRSYRKYGSEFSGKLSRYLEYLVENRKKYYEALARHPKSTGS